MRAPTGTAAACRARSGRRCCARARGRADKAGHYRYPFPKEYGGQDGTNLGDGGDPRASRGEGPRPAQRPAERALDRRQQRRPAADVRTTAPTSRRAEWIDDMLNGRRGFAFGITEPEHGSDATHMETRARRDGDGWVINGEKTWNTGIHAAKHDMIFARTSGKAGRRRRHHRFLVPTKAQGFKVEEFLWTFNMPTDHAPHLADERACARRRDLRRRRHAACRWCSTSSTRTASARRHRPSARRSSASTSRSSTRRCASRSASRCRPTRRSSSRSSSCRRSARCCAR